MGRLFDEWQRQQDSRSLKAELAALAKLADYIKARNITSVYFTNTDDDIRDRLFGDFLVFVVFVWSYTQTIYNSMEELEQEFTDYVNFESDDVLLLQSIENLMDRVFAFKSPLVLCVVDRLCIIDGRRGHVINLLMDIYVAAINKLFAKNEHMRKSWTTLLLDDFVKQCDDIANKIVGTEEPSPTPIDHYELPPFVKPDNTHNEELMDDQE